MPRFALVTFLALAACADVPEPAAPAPEAAAVVAAPVAPSATRGDTTSVYSDLDLDACDVLSEHEMGVELRCPGHAGVDLFVSEGDLRFDVDAGVPNGRFETASAFNTLGETVEWRLADGVPFAVIVRYHLDDGRGGRRSELAVIAVGEEGAPGCLVGWVDGNARPSQNEAARALADAAASPDACVTDG